MVHFIFLETVVDGCITRVIKSKSPKEIVDCFKAGGEVDEDKLAEHLPWCYEAYNVVKSVDVMKNFLEQLDLSELKDEVAAAESTITLNVNDGHTQTEMKFNELINLNSCVPEPEKRSAGEGKAGAKFNFNAFFLKLHLALTYASSIPYVHFLLYCREDELKEEHMEKQR
eukprot:scaffold7114_cov98-Skeletonema_dohrnii-CCMP3373.AAC.1